MQSFTAFSAAHWAAIIACVFVCAGIVMYRRQLRIGSRSRIAAGIIAAMLAGLETALYISYTIQGEWTVWSLPFELCTMTLWMSVIMLLTRSRMLYNVVVYLGTLGALQAMLTPDLVENFPQFRYFHFFLGHIGIIAASVYMTAVERMRPTLRSLPIAVLALHLLAIPGAIINTIAGTNYMFLARKPEGGSLLDILGPWPWYLLELEPIVWVMCAILLGIVTLVDRIAWRRKHV
ncbi:putative integral membrane protein (TIGR02206 family) [Paenibacillus cellulosilyticus]|uniref:Putative integral membrane protein (TIGR02206 family) n=1 Tax=Paenibacillus cellulosilyticus TaxID=375489 RepID=A0A2V2YPN6_9BACL|nr:TIGR02206 family membrane protein [Paenibacillus cellulosilyticus]PWV98460.1 putative integral membrane protein (TIGR02206 family) [Paenibacillus cellulosilyticus]QKS43302.1 TIGR02206 family membrane protein [Paenibacillus cellulosilyticus]